MIREPLIAPLKAGEKQGMKESHSEKLATHADPESCECVREGTLEALTGEPAGRVIEPRKFLREAETP